MKIKLTLDNIIQNAFAKADIDTAPIPVSDATKPEFGDYQFNGAMALSKKLGKNPKEIASNILSNIDSSGVISKMEIVGPGFLNIWLEPEWISKNLEKGINDSRLNVSTKEHPIKIVVDYSSPNMAKQMHVGHLRSTIIGDALVRLFSFLGDEVIRQNHIGDWGTQFGMLISYMEESEQSTYNSLSDLEQFYKDAKIKFDSDIKFAERSREYVVRLQRGDEHCIRLWKKFIDISLGHCEEIYQKLGISLRREDVRAESSYNNDLPKIVDQMHKQGLVVESNGAKCIFIDGYDTPLIVQKSDGGFLYSTTDLAAIRHRAQKLEAKRISYVVDTRQTDHFRQLFDAARRAGFVDDDVLLEHVSFGMMLDKSGRPFKTRDGGTVKLIDLLNEAVLRAKKMIQKRGVQETEEELKHAAQIVGLGAVKYAELSVNRQSNYIFDWDKMLSFDGNTSLYLQYAYARIHSILRKHGKNIEGSIVLEGDLERRLGLMLLRLEDTLYSAALESMPHYIAAYLYDLTTLFMKFYEQNPILKNGVDPKRRDSRLILASLTAKTIKQGLDLLGIEVLEKL